MKKNICRTLLAALLPLTLVLASTAAQAHASNPAGKTQSNAISDEQHDFGQQGDVAKAIRTMHITMNDAMRFEPGELVIKQGETVRFIVTNKGQIMHEMVLGTMEELNAHGEMMKKHPNMEHDEPYMAHVAPGKVEEMTWQFTQPGEFYFACLIPGHFESGMVGKIRVLKKG